VKKRASNTNVYMECHEVTTTSCYILFHNYNIPFYIKSFTLRITGISINQISWFNKITAKCVLIMLLGENPLMFLSLFISKNSCETNLRCAGIPKTILQTLQRCNFFLSFACAKARQYLFCAILYCILDSSQFKSKK